MSTVRIGVVGTNFISDHMVEGGSIDPRCRFTAVCSRRKETGEAFASRHGITHIFTSVEEMAASGEVDAVYIASPNACHAPQAIMAMKAGRHVLCEKPMASNAAEVQTMFDTAGRNNVVLLEAMIPAMSPVIKAVADNLHLVGKVRRYFATFCQYSSRYDRFLQGDIANAFRPELSNGALMDLGVYCLYPMVALFGEPQRVFTSATKLHTGADGQGTVVASYEGFDGVAVYSKIADSQLPAEIQGEKGTIVIDRISKPRRALFRPTCAHRSGMQAEDIDLTPPDMHPDPYYHEMRSFIDLIEARNAGNRDATLPLCNPTNSLRTTTLLDTVRYQCGLRFPADDRK